MSSALPSRKRSLFLRGYDRAAIGPGAVQSSSFSRTPTTTTTRASALLLLLLLALCLAFIFSLGRGVATATATAAAHSPNIHHPDASLRSSSSSSADGRLKIAVAITVTKDGPYLDGAAVLQHSVRMTRSRHEVEMVAIVHSEVQSTRPALSALGFRIVEFPLPILSQEIEGKHLRETIDKSGCCGAQELLKLCSWLLLDYDRVVAMDMDAIWLANLDHLLERQLPPGGFFFTYDFAMDGPNSRAPPVQGGFQLIRPDKSTYDTLVAIVRKGDFRPGLGWGGLNIGWCWGGQTIQGLLAYFANAIAPDLAFPLDPCTYNSMATTKSCRRHDYALVQTIHYTYCQKPWECHAGVGICAKFLQAWWMVRQDMERAQALPEVVPRCCRLREICPERTYRAVDVSHMRALPMSARENGVEVLPPNVHIVQLPPDLPLGKEREE